MGHITGDSGVGRREGIGAVHFPLSSKKSTICRTLFKGVESEVIGFVGTEGHTIYCVEQ